MSKLEKIDLRGTPNTELERAFEMVSKILNAAIDRINELEARHEDHTHGVNLDQIGTVETSLPGTFSAADLDANSAHEY